MQPGDILSSQQNVAELLEEAVNASRGVLTRNVSARGMAASGEVYPQVWARDTVITLLGGAIDSRPEMLDALKISLESLAAGQNRFGQIPFFIRIADGHAEFGSVDSNPWFVIGACYYAEQSGDRAWLGKMSRHLVAALDWCESRDFNQSGLIDSCECDDWADLLCNRGKVLFPNVLYAHALNMAAAHLEASDGSAAVGFRRRAAQVREAIQQKLWVAPTGSFEDGTHHQARMHMSVTLRRRPYFLPWVSLFEYGERFDAAGNLLAILTGAATAEQAADILLFIRQTGLDEPYPVRVLYPAIQPGEKDWRDYYKVWGNNLPDQYHNGGIWPWVGGLYVAALVKTGGLTEARRQLTRLALALRAGTEAWECNEWLHGRSGMPMGSKFQAWSAGMFLYAEYAVRTGRTPGFDPACADGDRRISSATP